MKDIWKKEWEIKRDKKSLPIESFIEQIDWHLNEIEKAKAFLIEAVDNPKLFLTDAKRGLGTSRESLFVALGIRREQPSSDRLKQQFMAHIASHIDAWINEWGREAGIKEEVFVLVRDEGQANPLLALYDEKGHEFMQFSIFKKFYGVRDSRTEEDIKKDIEGNIAQYREVIWEGQKRIEKDEEVLANPLSHTKGIKNLFLVLFERKKLNNFAEKRKASNLARIEDSQKEVARLEEWQVTAIEIANRKSKLSELFIPLFEELEYRFEEERHRLY